MSLKKEIERKDFYRNIGKLLHSGFSLDQALKSMDGRDSRYEMIIPLLINKFRENENLVKTLEEYPQYFPIGEISLINAYSKVGLTAEILNQLSNDIDLKVTLIKKVINQMIYPIVLLHLAIILFPFLDFLQEKILLIGFIFRIIIPLLIIYAIIIFIYRLVVMDWQKRSCFTDYILHLPLFGKLISLYELKRGIDIYRFLISSGMPINETLDCCKQNCSTKKFKKSFELALQSIKEGGDHIEGLKKNDVIPKDIIKTWHIGSIAGRECESLKEISDNLSNDIDLVLDRLQLIATKVVSIIIILFVAMKIVTNVTSNLNEVTQIIDKFD
ncbi:MAG: type II secretion system F family protein [Oligoflexia bacterium]|nr:type II secretion system F family protein [Oligoflexia bacterium]